MLISSESLKCALHVPACKDEIQSCWYIPHLMQTGHRDAYHPNPATLHRAAVLEYHCSNYLTTAL